MKKWMGHCYSGLHKKLPRDDGTKLKHPPHSYAFNGVLFPICTQRTDRVNTATIGTTITYVVLSTVKRPNNPLRPSAK